MAQGPPDGICASLGVGGSIILDMLDPIIDLPDANDLRVYEGGPTNDGYSVYVSQDWNGPWVFLGAGMGTAEFDLASGSIAEARYVRIVDDGDGNAYELNPGVDIDAVQNLAAAHANQPPENPVQPDGPTTGGTNVPCSYTTMTTDPESQLVYYLWDWDDGTESQWLGPFDSGAPATASHTWDTAGTYSVKVKAKDVLGLESGWSPSLSVHIDDLPFVEIGEVTGGLGITAKVRNSGTVDASNVTWSITLDGGLVLVGRVTTGTLVQILSGVSMQIRTGFLVGVGRITITVAASVAEKTVSGLLLGPFVVMRP
jgi:uncharacterized repeat protein (TIGR01451 family)